MDLESVVWAVIGVFGIKKGEIPGPMKVPPPPSIDYLGLFLILLIGLVFLGPVLTQRSYKSRERSAEGVRRDD